MFGQEDYDEVCNTEERHIINYIAKHVGEVDHYGGVILRLEDYSAAAHAHMLKRNPDADKHDCYVEVMITAEDMKAVQNLMLKLVRKEFEEGGY